jgi:hypothetical protein
MSTDLTNNILVCILHTEKNNSRYNNISNTWGKYIDHLFYSDNQDLDKNIYKVCDRNDYASAQEKQVNIINQMPEKYVSYDWYFFCDDDTFLNINKLRETLCKLDTNVVYGEIRNSWSTDRTLFYPMGGAGFLISGCVMNKIRGNFIDNSKYGIYHSDVTLGMNLRRLNIKMSPILEPNIESKNNQLDGCPLLNSQKPSFYGIEDSEVYKYISFHYITDYSEMEKLNKICMNMTS